MGSLFSLITAKPVLIAMHLGFAILAIDAFLWLLGEYFAKVTQLKRMFWSAFVGTLGFFASWIFGGYYYVKFYGTLVKPDIVGGLAPWAHAIAMEAKEHIFLLLPPVALTILFIVLSKNTSVRLQTMKLIGLIVFLALAIGAMGFIISAAARWAVVN